MINVTIRFITIHNACSLILLSSCTTCVCT